MTRTTTSRRDFLRQASALGVALGLGEWASGVGPAGIYQDAVAIVDDHFHGCQVRSGEGGKTSHASPFQAGTFEFCAN